MKKKSIQGIVDIIPDVLKNAAGWLKSNFDENGQEILGNASGSVGLVVKFFGKPLIDKYFKNLSKKKLDNFGMQIYLKAAYKQAALSMEKIEHDIKAEKTPEEVLESFSNLTTKNFEEINSNNILSIFQPIYHPVVHTVKENYIELLESLCAKDTLIKNFTLDFNENIENTIKQEFGLDYDTHLQKIKSFLLQENEAKLLLDTFQLGRIGFDATENLQYEKTFANWKEVSKFRENDYSDLPSDSDKTEELEKSLRPIETLIHEYFGRNKDNLGKMLFIIADFGKGKSVFMKHYASVLAKNYTESKEGYFPIYFNLREFKKYNRETQLGVISDFLLEQYGIDIRSEYFISKKYIFLLDSLDESGELTKRSIDQVMSSVQKIEELDKTKFRNNQIIITSRPISEGLEYHLGSHKPYVEKNQENRDIPYFISLYGFKKEQFNNWLYNTLKSISKPTNIDSISLVSKIFNAIAKSKVFDIYKELIDNRTLSISELRRPIFAYMIYRLIINNIDFLKVGRIGVYLSFLNFLTKDAKHIKDPHYEVNLEEEFKCRNILHATAALWMYESRKGKQGELKKASLCRVIKGEMISANDGEVLKEYRDVANIEFLSHSYFGEESDTLSFQHQSFAEILLAEYYLKIFIKYSLDKDTKLESARCKLHLGKPTEQTIQFFIELLNLLKETCMQQNDYVDDVVLEKRKLLFPLFASIATDKNNTLFSNHIQYKWYEPYCKFETNQTEYPQEALKNWCLGTEELEKLVLLASQIINSDKEYILSKAETKTSLFNNELTLLDENNIPVVSNVIDKWLALVVGEHLYTDVLNVDTPKLFNTDYKINFRYLFDLIKSIEYRDRESWIYPLFKGINVHKNVSTYNIESNLINFDFSFSHFENIDFERCVLQNTNFSYCKLESVTFILCYFYGYPLFEKVSIFRGIRFRFLVVANTYFHEEYEEKKYSLYFTKEQFGTHYNTLAPATVVRLIKSLHPFISQNDKIPCKNNLQILPKGLGKYINEALLCDYDEIDEYFRENREKILKKIYGEKISKNTENL